MRLVKRYERDIDWNIGCLFAHDDFVIKVIKVCKEAGTDPKITNVFGSIPCIFQGGRVPPRTATLSNSFDILSRYNELNIGCRLTFSNPNIEEKDLSDTTSNELLNHLNKSSGNGVIVTSDLLAKYIKEKYSNLQIISSQVKPSVEVGLGKDEVDYYNNLFELYDIVVVNPMKVHDAKFLKEIKYPERVEFIANHKCLPNCPMAGKHYQTVAELCKRMLTQADTEKTEKRLDDIMSWCLKTRQKYPFAGTSLSFSDICYLSKKGFIHFKLEGRDNDGSVFIRDMGDYIFNHEFFTRLSFSIMGNPV